MANNILQYEGKVWSTADLLIGAGIKQSDFPKFMMPYFALIMVESRLIRHARTLEEDFGRSDIDAFIEEFKEDGLGYNDFVVRKNKTLKDICKNDKAFDVDFHAYLKAFDPETKYLLGVDKGTEEEKFLDISGISGQLKKKRILFDTVKAWSEIDLTPFNNSEITTLEEHIKRKWADISAETAGEQYTPDDIIFLISEIITSKLDNNGKFLTIYDPTCGGGNLLFGVEDNIKATFNRPTKTFGEDWSDSLYALAKIESRFRVDADIRYGNTLTNISFIEKKFDIVVANPPYGVDWKGYKKDIENDTTGRFIDLPSISDGQFLFTQHIVSQLADDGISVVVHNGSTLFSGDAGSGESNIRKYFLDEDIVEAIIQMPTDEFFNTGIYTYLWVFNKNKAKERKDKIILINASELYKPLKKSRGKKRKYMEPENRAAIVKALAEFKDNEFSKVFDKWHFYYNRQAIMLTNIDENGKTFESLLPVKTNKDGEEVRAKSQKLDPVKIVQIDEDGTTEITEFEITEFDSKQYTSLMDYYEKNISPKVAALDYKETDLKVYTDKSVYWYDADKDTLIEETKGKQKELGCGKIVLKSSLKKATAKSEAYIEITAELTPDYEKDYEIVPYSPVESINQSWIDAFMQKFVTKPFRYLDNVIGVELNFNKLFYKKAPIDKVSTIFSALQSLQLDYHQKEDALAAINLTDNSNLIDCEIEWIDKMPKQWKKYRIKDIGYLYSGISGKKGDDFNQDDNEHNKGFIPFTNIANNTYIKKDDLGTVVIYEHENQNKVKKYDLFFLMSSEGYEDVGKSAVLMEDVKETYLNSFCKGLRITMKNVSPKFLNYLLLSTEFRHKLILEGKGFTRINLKMEKIKDFEFIIPADIKEQVLIENFLDEKTALIDETIKNMQAQIDTLKVLRKNIINDVATGKLLISK